MPPNAKVTATEEKLMKESSQLSITSLSVKDELKLPRRPGYSTIGTPVILRANYFEIMSKPNLQLYRYNVDMNPDPGVARKRKRLFQLLLETAPFLTHIASQVATDNRSTLISMTMLDLGKEGIQEGSIPYFEAEDSEATARARSYNFRVSYTNTLSIQQLVDYLCSVAPQARFDDKESILQALNIVMSRKPSNDAQVTSAGSKYFPTTSFLANLNGGLVAIKGYFSSVRTSTSRLLLNVNCITAASYLPGSLLQLMQAFRSTFRGTYQAQLVQLNRFLKGVRIETTHLKTKKGAYKTRVVNGLATGGKGATQVAFDWDAVGDGKLLSITVADYFLRSNSNSYLRGNC